MTLILSERRALLIQLYRRGKAGTSSTDKTHRPITHNAYFEGKVQSLRFSSATCRATVGVILPGAYTFSADSEEHLTLIEGTVRVKIDDRWLEIGRNETHMVPCGSSFEVQA